jgi:rod shape-determining protein MreD
MSELPRRGGWLIGLSLLIALALTILPMPDAAEGLRPQWVVLLILYWCLAVPERFGVFAAFGAGLTLDVISGSLLGQHALTLTLVGYAAVALHQRVRLFPVWQQMLFVWVLLLLERVINLWILAATGQSLPGLGYWLATLLGGLLWPWLSVIMSDLGRRAGVVH